MDMKQNFYAQQQSRAKKFALSLRFNNEKKFMTQEGGETYTIPEAFEVPAINFSTLTAHIVSKQRNNFLS